MVVRSASLFDLVPIASAQASTLRGAIHVRGSTTLLSVIQLAAEDYMAENPGVIVTVSAGGTVRGMRAVINGTADLAMASAGINDDLRKHAAEHKLRLVAHAVAHDAVVPCLHPDNRVSDLTVEQLRMIYTGEITNWKEVGGADAKIQVTSYDPFSGTYESWRELVMDEMSVTPKATILEGGGVKTRVAQTAEAIGYIALTQQDATVKVPTVEGMAATTATIRAGQYPLRRPLNLVAIESEAAAAGAAFGPASFIAFMRDPRKGRPRAAAAGLVTDD